MKKEPKSHAAEQLKSRFGIALTPDLAHEIKERILSGNPVVVEEQKENNRTVYRMVVKNRVMFVVFSWRTKHVVTVMPTWYGLFKDRK